MNEREHAIHMIRLGDNMRLRRHLGQPISKGEAQTYNQAVYTWDRARRNLPKQRIAADNRQEARR